MEKSKSKIENKITHPRGKREKKVQVRQGSNIKQEIMKKEDRQENAHFFADFRLARIARGVKQRQKHKNKHIYISTPPLRTPAKQEETN